jgi:hypothetical protein
MARAEPIGARIGPSQLVPVPHPRRTKGAGYSASRCQLPALAANEFKVLTRWARRAPAVRALHTWSHFFGTVRLLSPGPDLAEAADAEEYGKCRGELD